jgi:peptidyl-tRNA hydrolase, PTH1 family
MKLIVGLGNPGLMYAKNRHNIGFMCVSYFAKKHGIAFDKKQGQARVGHGKVAGEEIVIARPQTFMNESGQAVTALIQRYKISLEDLIVIHDDLDLPVAKMRIRLDGSSGGHKGINSIVNRTGSPDFIRVRVGIGRPVRENGQPPGEGEVIDYVLGDFTSEEKTAIDEIIPRIDEALVTLIGEGLDAAMNKFN